VRAGLASLGLRSLDELVGRADLLRQRDMALAKTTGLDLSFITTYAGPVEASSKRIAQCAPSCILSLNRPSRNPCYGARLSSLSWWRAPCLV